MMRVGIGRAAIHAQALGHQALGIIPSRDALHASSTCFVNRSQNILSYTEIEAKTRTQRAALSSSTAASGRDGAGAVSATSSSPQEDDRRFMALALEQAQLAAAAGEVPVGAVMVSGAGEVLAAAHNATEAQSDPTAHAELQCIRQAAQRAGGWRLLDATLYVTLEPCPMCAGALLQSRVGRVVYGARNALLGADGSWIDILRSRVAAGTDNDTSSSESGGEESEKACRPSRPHPFHPDLAVESGVLGEECGAVMKAFFKRRRQQQQLELAKMNSLEP